MYNLPATGNNINKLAQRLYGEKEVKHGNSNNNIQKNQGRRNGS